MRRMVKGKRSSSLPVRRKASAAEVTKELRTKGYRVVAMSRSIKPTLSRQRIIEPPMLREERHDLLAELHRVGRIGDVAEFVGAIMDRETAPFMTASDTARRRRKKRPLLRTPRK